MTLFYVVREQYEPEVAHLGKLVQPGTVFVDAGANCGIYTMAAANLVGPAGKVLAFEPGAHALEMLRKNVEINGYGHICVFPVALSEKEGTARLYAHEHGTSSFTLGRTEEGERLSFTIETVTLDAVLAREGIERVDVLKMDVEGAEELILRGAVALFERCRPKVIFEVNPEAIANLALSERGAWDFLAARGYQFHAMSVEGVLTRIDVPPAGANVIALPPAEPQDLPRAVRGPR